jgi:hypothetical protein
VHAPTSYPAIISAEVSQQRQGHRADLASSCPTSYISSDSADADEIHQGYQFPSDGAPPHEVTRNEAEREAAPAETGEAPGPSNTGTAEAATESSMSGGTISAMDQAGLDPGSQALQGGLPGVRGSTTEGERRFEEPSTGVPRESVPTPEPQPGEVRAEPGAGATGWREGETGLEARQEGSPQLEIGARGFGDGLGERRQEGAGDAVRQSLMEAIRREAERPGRGPWGTQRALRAETGGSGGAGSDAARGLGGGAPARLSSPSVAPVEETDEGGADVVERPIGPAENERHASDTDATSSRERGGPEAGPSTSEPAPRGRAGSVMILARRGPDSDGVSDTREDLERDVGWLRIAGDDERVFSGPSWAARGAVFKKYVRLARGGGERFRAPPRPAIHAPEDVVGLHVRACGHVIHLQCLEWYFHSLLQSSINR